MDKNPPKCGVWWLTIKDFDAKCQYSSPCRLQASSTRSAAGMRTLDRPVIFPVSNKKRFLALPKKVWIVFVLNHGKAVYGIRNMLRYGIIAQRCMESTQGGMESRPKSKRYTLSRDAMRGRAAIPYNSHCELMPYQALRAWINKKTNRSSSFYFGGPSRTRTLDRPVMSR